MSDENQMQEFIQKIIDIADDIYDKADGIDAVTQFKMCHGGCSSENIDELDDISRAIKSMSMQAETLCRALLDQINA